MARAARSPAGPRAATNRRPYEIRFSVLVDGEPACEVSHGAHASLDAAKREVARAYHLWCDLVGGININFRWQIIDTRDGRRYTPGGKPILRRMNEQEQQPAGRLF